MYLLFLKEGWKVIWSSREQADLSKYLVSLTQQEQISELIYPLQFSIHDMISSLRNILQPR
jgi:hypothetical protein